MQLLSAHIPAPWLQLSWLLALVLMLLVARRAAWFMLRDRANLNVFLGATVAVLGLWLIKTGIKPGLAFHLLGATALTLMFRPLFALLSVGLITAALSVWQGEFAAFAVNWLMLGALPVGVSWSIFRLVDGRLPNHLFIYIFLNAFFGAAVAILMVGLFSTAFIALSGAYSLDYLRGEYLPYFLLIAWSEAFLTGMLITIMVVWRPEWVATFDDHRYLNR
ncbi:MAG TPA: energy-coupling factor ABC transporter permease [Thiobacillaceae bacterium]|nr:energy-coupling factor ABC transporter permease [Thiobacillaceae bacterium]HNU64207.1 energy-coupling factor ABC transporter permease [Thiobacillaceae bacterium]